MTLVYRGFTEDELREIVQDTVDLARNRSTPGNVSDEAVVQKILKEKFVNGHWVSSYFFDEKETNA